MKPKAVKQALKDTISALNDCRWMFSARPGKDNTRNRKFPFQKMIYSILSFRAGTLNHEIMDHFGYDSSVGSSSAFIQQRAKILPEAFEYLFQSFTDKVDQNKTYRGYRLLAVDGSDLQIAANPHDPDSYYPGTNGQKPYNLLHINAMYDLMQHIYVDAIVHKSRNADESAALTAMTDRSVIQNALLIADRGYESYNNLAHIQEKGWAFLIRIRDGVSGIASGLDLPNTPEFDVPFHLNLTKKQAKSIEKLFEDRNHYRHISTLTRFDYLPQTSRNYAPTVFYELRFRIVRFPISDSACETIITNLDADRFPLEEIKKLYSMRWGIETSFRDLKHTLGLLYLHAKKVESVLQEIFAKFIMYNFCELITQSVVIQQGNRKYVYKINFSDSAHICLAFFLGRVTPPNLEALLMKFISPIRPGRSDPRKQSPTSTVSFIYRVA